MAERRHRPSRGPLKNILHKTRASRQAEAMPLMLRASDPMVLGAGDPSSSGIGAAEQHLYISSHPISNGLDRAALFRSRSDLAVRQSVVLQGCTGTGHLGC